MMARVVKALNRHVEPVFNPERKDTQGRALQNYILIEVVGLPIRIRNAVKIRRTEDYRRSPRNRR
jgi:hypothetical protein